MARGSLVTEKEMPAVGHPTEDELLALSDGVAKPAERERLVAHLDGCTSCRALLAEFTSSSSASRSSDPLIGSMVGGYLVESYVSKGAMGAVYVARAPNAQRPVALKLALPSRDARVRMRAEARALAALSHPNVVGVFGFGELSDGRPWIAMEYLEGETLNVRLSRKTPGLRLALEWMDSLLGGLSACHEKQVIHRDLKPSNVLLVDGEVKLIDFGLARQDEATAITNPESVMGSVGFLAPELLEGTQASAASDLYAVGCIAWQVLTGTPVFKTAGQSPLRVMRAHLEKPAPKLREVLDDASPELEAWLAGLLERDPKKRSSMKKARRELEIARHALEATVIDRAPVGRPTRKDRPKLKR
ncbi:MAG: serine/threonine protein kinase [Archangium sp.]|nr:serine/threonine protein kinase [Archangium sp.]